MRRVLGVLVSGILLLSVLAVPASAKSRPSTTEVDCRAGADLQAALDAASPGDTLLIRGSCVGNFATDAAGHTPIAGLTLEGRGARPTINGGLSAGSSDITLVGLTITNGGIFSGGGLTLVDSTVRDSGSCGIFTLGSATISRSTLRDNQGCGIRGPSLTIDRSTISGNGDYGIITGAYTTISHSVVKDNAAGGIFLYRSLSIGLSANINVVDTRIVDNDGPGIYNGLPLTIRDSLISRNDTSGVGGGINNRYFPGLYEQGILTLIDSRVIKNSASDGGGIFSTDPSAVRVDHSVIKHNTPNDCTGCP